MAHYQRSNRTKKPRVTTKKTHQRETETEKEKETEKETDRQRPRKRKRQTDSNREDLADILPWSEKHCSFSVSDTLGKENLISVGDSEDSITTSLLVLFPPSGFAAAALAVILEENPFERHRFWLWL